MNQEIKDRVGYKVKISGIVQGVGFRYFTAQEATQLIITGYAKNMSDGSVEVLMFGQRTQLATLLNWLEKGPKSAIVNNVSAMEIPYVHTNSFVCL